MGGQSCKVRSYSKVVSACVSLRRSDSPDSGREVSQASKSDRRVRQLWHVEKSTTAGWNWTWLFVST